MADYNNTPAPADNSGTNTGLIILAFVIIAAIVVGAIYFMNSPAPTNTNTTTVDRTVSRIEQVPAPAQPAPIIIQAPAQTAPATTDDTTVAQPGPATPQTTSPQ